MIELVCYICLLANLFLYVLILQLLVIFVNSFCKSFLLSFYQPSSFVFNVFVSL